jgi:hypothetical protein
LEKDSEKFEEILDPNDSYLLDDGQVGMTVFEANYGGQEELKQLVDEKYSFYGRHDAGDNYGSMLFACFEGDFVEVLAFQDCPGARLFYDNEGFACPISEDIEDAEKYFEVYEEVRILFHP